jgi:hypothetical protein
MKVTEHRGESQMIDDKRLQETVDRFVFRVGAIAVAAWDLEREKPDACDTFLALLAELRAIARQLPISARPDGALDLSRLPEWARFSLERRFAVLLHYLLRVPMSESESRG